VRKIDYYSPSRGITIRFDLVVADSERVEPVFDHFDGLSDDGASIGRVWIDLHNQTPDHRCFMKNYPSAQTCAGDKRYEQHDNDNPDQQVSLAPGRCGNGLFERRPR